MELIVEKFELGVSFSGEQRTYVRNVVEIITGNGFKVFFDEHRPEELIGEFLPSKLAYLFGRQFNYTAIFISKSYTKSPFCRAELDACVSTNLKFSRTFLIPLRFDKTKIKPLNKLYGYADIGKLSPEKCGQLIMSKIAWKIDTIRINGLIASDHFEQAERRLTSAYRCSGRLANKNLSFVLYNLACTCSLIAENLANKGEAAAATNYLERSFTYYSSWFESKKYNDVGWSADEAMAKADNDPDLHFLRVKRNSAIYRMRVRLGFDQKVSKGRGSGGCVLDDTPIETPNGKVHSQRIQLWSRLISLDQTANWRPVFTQVTAIKRAVSNEWLEIDALRCTRSQRLLEEVGGWIEADNVRPGMRLMMASGSYEAVSRVERHRELVSVTIFETDHPTHNFIANGFICHNMKF